MGPVHICALVFAVSPFAEANINCIIYCVLNLFYWDSLTESDAIGFLRENPQVLGETVIYMVESYVFFVLVIATWYYATYGQRLATGIFISITATCIANLATVWANLLRWRRNKRSDDFPTCGKCCKGKGRKRPEELEWFQLMDSMVRSDTAVSEQGAAAASTDAATDEVDTPQERRVTNEANDMTNEACEGAERLHAQRTAVDRNEEITEFHV